MNFLSEGVMKKISLIAAAAIFAAGCAGGSDKENNEQPSYYTDLQYRDSVLLAEGMIHYGNDPDAGSFDDIYYAFAARDNERAKASADAAEAFRKKVDAMSHEERAYMEYIFSDYADLADLANYSYKDSEVELPDGWIDLGAGDAALAEIISRYSRPGVFSSGLKCSLMAKDNRRLLVFAGTDFPASWTDFSQVMDFVKDAYEDVNGALNADASQVVMAGELVDELLASGYVTEDNLEFAGHSLGGRLASEMAVRYDCPAVLFNAAGVSPEVYQMYESARKSAGNGWRGYIVDVTAANDPLTHAQKYMSGSSDPFVSTAADALSVDKETVEELLSIGLGALGVSTDKYSDVVDKYYERDYRALGAVMPVKENMGGHGIKELAAALRSRAEVCAD